MADRSGSQREAVVGIWLPVQPGDGLRHRAVHVHRQLLAGKLHARRWPALSGERFMARNVSS